ncbi:MAG: hypothetical protein HY036_00700 [Nitrospirae bacterium]|nr:hypothetical protein [Nitrospirota bacterium]MBI3351074.1 hypothetical protein [Nitrospirota bacterium]
MLSAQRKILSSPELREAGWKILVKNLGLINATRFILEYESGYGDYTKIKKEFFKHKNVDELFNEIKQLERPGKKLRVKSY